MFDTPTSHAVISLETPQDDDDEYLCSPGSHSCTILMLPGLQ